MGFWTFMLFTNLLIPAIMSIMGYFLKKHPPKKINNYFGYRTTMSMKNNDTWIFANKHSGQIMFYWGLYLLPLSSIPYLFLFTKSDNFIGIIGLVICLIQLLIMIFTIFKTEKALKMTFDENGNRKI